MTGGRVFPDERAGPFEAPPLSFVDGEDREIELRPADADDVEALAEMYLAFDPADRAQGIPPSGEETIRRWLDTLTDEGLNVVAWHGADAAGHAVLVPDGGGKGTEDPAPDDPENPAYELAIFVLQEYQRAGIGRHLMRGLLGHGEHLGIEKVWLTVERWNHAAVSLYESLGFETCGAQSFEKEMSILLSPEDG